MLVDYHVHIERGPYTFEWLDQFMETAQRNGVSEVGIVEHSHRFKEMAFLYDKVIQDESKIGIFQHKWLQSRLGQTTVPQYVEFMVEAKRRGYPVKMGFEICYFPFYEAETRNILATIEPDFIIGSIHWLDGFGFDHLDLKSEWNGLEQRKMQEGYQGAIRAAIKSGLFDIIGHIDSIKAFNPWGLDGWTSDELALELKNHNVCLEINTGLKHRGMSEEFCPNESFLHKCFKAGVEITLSSDAHSPDAVGNLFKEAVTLAKKAGYQEIIRFNCRKREKVSL